MKKIIILIFITMIILLTIIFFLNFNNSITQNNTINNKLSVNNNSNLIYDFNNSPTQNNVINNKLSVDNNSNLIYDFNNSMEHSNGIFISRFMSLSNNIIYTYNEFSHKYPSFEYFNLLDNFKGNLKIQISNSTRVFNYEDYQPITINDIKEGDFIFIKNTLFVSENDDFIIDASNTEFLIAKESYFDSLIYNNLIGKKQVSATKIEKYNNNNNNNNSNRTNPNYIKCTVPIDLEIYDETFSFPFAILLEIDKSYLENVFSNNNTITANNIEISTINTITDLEINFPKVEKISITN